MLQKPHPPLPGRNCDEIDIAAAFRESGPIGPASEAEYVGSGRRKAPAVINQFLARTAAVLWIIVGLVALDRFVI
jgi:hypothetical protein